MRPGLFLAIGCSGQLPDLELHPPLRRKADHLAQQISVGGLLHERAKLHHLFGHRCFLRARLVFATGP
jgi:hypothetical protein